VLRLVMLVFLEKKIASVVASSIRDRGQSILDFRF
jgi:hypothetical protein